MDGANTRGALARKGLLTARHLGFYLHAARVLGVLCTEIEPFAATFQGQSWMSTGPGSDRERKVLREAIEASDLIQQLAPGLLAAEAPARELLARRIQTIARVEAATARRLRAAAMSCFPPAPRPSIGYGR